MKRRVRCSCYVNQVEKSDSSFFTLSFLVSKRAQGTKRCILQSDALTHRYARLYAGPLRGTVAVARCIRGYGNGGHAGTSGLCLEHDLTGLRRRTFACVGDRGLGCYEWNSFMLLTIVSRFPFLLLWFVNEKWTKIEEVSSRTKSGLCSTHHLHSRLQPEGEW